MKTLKNAKQKNVILNRDYYTTQNLCDLLKERCLFYFDGLEIKFDEVNYFNVNDYVYRVPLSIVKELKVIYSKEYECYLTIAVFNENAHSELEWVVVDI